MKTRSQDFHYIAKITSIIDKWVNYQFSININQELLNLSTIHRAIIDSYTPTKQDNVVLTHCASAIFEFQDYNKTLPKELIFTIFEVIKHANDSDIKRLYIENLNKILTSNSYDIDDKNYIAKLYNLNKANLSKESNLETTSSSYNSDISSLYSHSLTDTISHASHRAALGHIDDIIYVVDSGINYSL